MELLQLRYFYESACLESITKAAERYLVPPSSVSLSIKRLERELGCELFARSGNRIHLNDNGRVLKHALEVSFGELDRAVARLTAPLTEQSGDIFLLVRSERQFLLDCISAFREQYPGVVFHLSHDFSVENLMQFDIIIDASTVYYENFQSVPIVRENIRIAAAEDHPLCGRELTLWDLREQPFITMYKGSSMQRITIDCCRRAGFSPNIIIESDDPQYLRKYIGLGFGLAFIPEISWQGQMEGTRYLQVTDLREQRITCAHLNRKKPLSPAAEAFYAMLLEKQRMDEI